MAKKVSSASKSPAARKSSTSKAAPARATSKPAVKNSPAGVTRGTATKNATAKGAASAAPSKSTPAKSKSAKSRSFLAGLDAEMAAAGLESRKPPSKRAKSAKEAKDRAGEGGPVWEFAVEAARLLRDDKCEDVVMLDVRGRSQITDYVVIGSGTSERQMRSILHHVEDIGAARGFQAFRSNTDDRASWVLVDFVDVVVHLFEPNTRAHYDLENLWPEAPRIQWERPDQLQRDRAGLHA